MTTSAAVAARTQQQPREAAPFVKWAGGKGRLLSQLRPLLPPGIARMRHVEPFVGGGALFFARLPERALLTDINPALVATYTAIRDDVQSVIDDLRGLASRHSRESYYVVREHYNEGRRLSTSKRAAMFIYLNKTCFNGLHRVNRKGEFNVPVGSYKSPRILNESGLHAASDALQAAKIECTGFESLLEKAKPGDFVYFDPPYEPVSETASFTSYARDGFSREHQVRLRDVYRALDRRGCKLMLSNSDVPVIRKLYRAFRIETVAAPRAINCNAKKRGKVSEVVVRNY
ncbi:MAG: DNA adenine methylase [Myxococcales bacterium]|nr:DNA adenine methylase [Myxococcales bacterium]MDH3845458.1 DNA adenine methylase [Myxococcales bacterium]